MEFDENSLSRNKYVAIPNDRRVGLIFDERMCEHYAPYDKDHPECPGRIRAIWDRLNSSGLTKRCIILNAKDAEDKHLALVHTKKHIDLIKNISSVSSDFKRKKIAAKHESIFFSKGSSKAAYLAAGSVIEVAEKVAKGELNSAFAIVRPPGHHAEHDQPMGFCLHNNVAIATSYLLNERRDMDINKILIVDWDVHHGNGTQKMFYDDPRVLVFSVHRYDNATFFPCTHDGSYIMTGEDQGAGYNINVPWESGECGDADYNAVWDQILIPVAKEYNPDLIIISAGFDAAIGDPLGGCNVSPYGFSILLEKLMKFAGGKIVMALEGGYNLKSTANSAHACVEVLLQGKRITGSLEAEPFKSTLSLIEEVRQILSTYWPIFDLAVHHGNGSGFRPPLLLSQTSVPASPGGGGESSHQRPIEVDSFPRPVDDWRVSSDLEPHRASLLANYRNISQDPSTQAACMDRIQALIGEAKVLGAALEEEKKSLKTQLDDAQESHRSTLGASEAARLESVKALSDKAEECIRLSTLYEASEAARLTAEKVASDTTEECVRLRAGYEASEAARLAAEEALYDKVEECVLLSMQSGEGPNEGGLTARKRKRTISGGQVAHSEGLGISNSGGEATGPSPSFDASTSQPPLSPAAFAMLLHLSSLSNRCSDKGTSTMSVSQILDANSNSNQQVEEARSELTRQRITGSDPNRCSDKGPTTGKEGILNNLDLSDFFDIQAEQLLYNETLHKKISPNEEVLQYGWLSHVESDTIEPCDDLESCAFFCHTSPPVHNMQSPHRRQKPRTEDYTATLLEGVCRENAAMLEQFSKSFVASLAEFERCMIERLVPLIEMEIRRHIAVMLEQFCKSFDASLAEIERRMNERIVQIVEIELRRSGLLEMLWKSE